MAIDLRERERERERERKKERKKAPHKEFLVMYPH
jgi:hypothetical protein